MENSDIKTVQSFVGYIQEVDNIVKAWNTEQTTMPVFYRGQSDASWHLVPKLYRDHFAMRFEHEMTRDFTLKAHRLLDGTTVLSEFEWLFIMQHYGMPTRLLDWTESHLIALFFAVSGGREKTDAAIWVLHPWLLNEYALEMRTVPMSSHEKFSAYSLSKPDVPIQAKYPAALRPVYNSIRIMAQKGVFTIHGHDTHGLDENKTIFPNRALKKLVIDHNRKKDILKKLYSAGIGSFTACPELSGLCAEITYRYSKEYYSKPKGVITSELKLKA